MSLIFELSIMSFALLALVTFQNDNNWKNGVKTVNKKKPVTINDE